MSTFHTALQDYVEAVVTEAHREVGQRANAVLEITEQVDERDGIRSSIIDLFGDAFVVLTDPTGREPLAAAVDAVDDARVPLQWHVIDAVGWLDAYGLRAGGMVLVRPDGHVAWRSIERPKDAARELGAALDVAIGSVARSPASSR